MEKDNIYRLLFLIKTNNRGSTKPKKLFKMILLYQNMNCEYAKPIKKLVNMDTE